MNAFNPQLITDPRLNPAMAMPEPAQPQFIPEPIQSAPMAPPLMPKQAFMPAPIVSQPPAQPKNKMSVSAAVARKAQGIYPAEQQAKQKMIDNSKSAPPTPTGAWGSPA